MGRLALGALMVLTACQTPSTTRPSNEPNARYTLGPGLRHTIETPSLKAVVDEQQNLLVRGGHEYIEFEDHQVKIVVSGDGSRSGLVSAQFFVALTNKTVDVMRLRVDSVLRLEGSNNGITWVSLLLEPSEQTWRRFVALGGPEHARLALRDNDILPGERYFGYVEFVIPEDQGQFAFYRLLVGTPPKVARFLFENRKIIPERILP